MRNRIFLTLLVGCLTFFGAKAQQQLSLEDLLLEPSALLQGELQAGGNSVFQKIEGTDNTLSIGQTKNGAALEFNLVRTLQVGDRNAAFLEQIGTGNQIVLIQNGTGNTYSMVQEGVNNSSVVFQNGNDNLITQELMNASGVYSEFIQNGNGNEIIHITEGFINQNFIIRQNGDGLKATVIQSN